VSLSAGRQAFYSKPTRVETGVVCSDHGIAVDGLSHLANGVHAALDDGVAVVRPGLIPQSAADTGGWDDDVLCARQRWIRSSGPRHPEANRGGGHPDDQHGDDCTDSSPTDRTPRSATTGQRDAVRQGR
jgi:hypothetical protein